MRLYVWRNETATNFNWIQLPLFLLISWTRKKIHSIQWNVTPVQRRLVWKISYLFICFVFGFFFFSCCLNFRLVSVFGFHPNWALCTKKSGFLTHPSQYITGQPIHSVCVLMIHFHAVCASVIGALFSNFFRLYARFSQIASLSQPTFGWCFGCVMWYEGKKANSQITMTTHTGQIGYWAAAKNRSMRKWIRKISRCWSWWWWWRRIMETMTLTKSKIS